jgi:hypothetical protein
MARSGSAWPGGVRSNSKLLGYARIAGENLPDLLQSRRAIGELQQTRAGIGLAWQPHLRDDMCDHPFLRVAGEEEDEAVVKEGDPARVLGGHQVEDV